MPAVITVSILHSCEGEICRNKYGNSANVSINRPKQSLLLPVQDKPCLNFSKATYKADKMMEEAKPLELLVYNFLEPYNNPKQPSTQKNSATDLLQKGNFRLKKAAVRRKTNKKKDNWIWSNQ